MIRGYLLDTNIICYWFDTRCPEHKRVVGRLASRPSGSPLTVSVLSLGEIEYGHRVASKDVDSSIQAQFSAFVRSQLPRVLDIQRTTGIYYGKLRALLFEKYAPGDKIKTLRPEQLIDPTTSLELGIQENDLWIAAQATERNLALVTHDKMAHIRAVADELVFEDWAE